MQNFEWQTVWCTPWFQFCLPHSLHRQHRADRMQLKTEFRWENTTRFSQEGGGGRGKEQGHSLMQPAEGAAYTYKYKRACNGSCRGFLRFLSQISHFPKTISKLPWTYLWYSHPVLSSCSNKTIFYCLQIQTLKVSLFCPGSGMGKRVKINSLKNSFPERVTCIPKQPSFA